MQTGVRDVRLPASYRPIGRGRMLRAERQCDELFRQARTAMVKNLRNAPVDLMLANDLAATLENATDNLLRAGYALRQMVLNKTGMSA